MKKIILMITVTAFGFSAHAAEPATKTCIDVGQALTDGTSVSDIIDSLTAPSCGMSLQDAAGAVIAAGGDKEDTLAAALVLDTCFAYYADPTIKLASTASGGGGDVILATDAVSILDTTGGGGGGASPK